MYANSRPILFSSEMVKAILDGRKSQTRRVVKGIAFEWLATDKFSPDYVAHPGNGLSSYGYTGDQLWVRETWATHPFNNRIKPSDLTPGDTSIFYRANDWNNESHYSWRPSIFMPRWASRITLEVVRTRVERLQEISEADARAEGVSPAIVGDDLAHLAHRAGYQSLWEKIHGEVSWDENPWVWVIEFRRLGA